MGAAGAGRGIERREKSQLRQRAEAVHAADVALRHLNRSLELLDSAHDWGTFDMFIGGIVSSMIKHKRIADAEEEFNAARNALKRFARELSDVDGEEISLDAGSVASAIDIFADNIFADIFVQFKINKSQRRVRTAIAQVSAIRAQLMRV